MDEKQVPIVGYYNDNGNYIRGIEDYISMSQYRRDEHQQEVIKDILDNWIRLSRNGKFHTLLATSSIVEAIEYYRILKDNPLGLKVIALFDKNFDYTGDTLFKQDGLVEIIEDYNAMFSQDFSILKQAQFKKDIILRLAHKYPYHNIEKDKDKQIDIVIVVDQLLTGFYLQVESMVNQVRMGAIEATEPSDGHLASIYPNIQVFSIPYLFSLS